MINLVEDWKDAWRWVSVNCMLVAGSIQATWILIPEDMRATVPQSLISGLTLSILALGVIGRITKQKPKKKKAKSK